jgi:GntR family transcriptional repressor for pyruvate dehydrogenase complex
MQGQFGTRRGVVREAIKMLKQKGLLEVRKGVKGGAYVRRLEVANVSESLALFLKQHPVDPEKRIEFRESVDRSITLLAITRATPAEKAYLLQEALRFEALLKSSAPDISKTGEIDRALSILLARLARNPIFEWVMHALQMGYSSQEDALHLDPIYRTVQRSPPTGVIPPGRSLMANRCGHCPSLGAIMACYANASHKNGTTPDDEIKTVKSRKTA